MTDDIIKGGVFSDEDKRIMNENACPNCKAVNSFFTGPRGGESQMMVCDNCHLEVTNHQIVIVSNGICDLQRLKDAYSGIPSMNGDTVYYISLIGEKLPKINHSHKPWYKKLFQYKLF